MQIRVLGAHNCESPQTKLVSLLVDQVLALDAGAITSSLSFSEQRQLKALLLTHHHFDHIRDLPTLGLNLYAQQCVEVYAPQHVIDIVSSCILTDEIYMDFRSRPSRERPTFKLCPVEPHKELKIQGYTVLPLPVNHGGGAAIGYQITSPDQKSIFYTGDTSRNSLSLWQKVSAQLLIMELTMPNDSQELAEASSHLTPRLLREELCDIKRARGSLPPIVTIHMRPEAEDKIREEIAEVARELKADITMGYEGMIITL